MHTSARNLLGLSAHESKIWDAIQQHDLNISHLATLTKFPRTTLYTALRSLEQRGLAKLRTKGRSVMVSATSRHEVADLLTRTALIFNDAGTVRISTTDDNSSGFTVIYGKDAMLRVWKKLATKKNERIYCIQPSKSLLSTIRRFKAGEFVPVNEAIKKNKIIMETLMREDGLATYLDFHKAEPRVQKEIIQSFMGRMADTTLVGNDYLNNNADLLITSREAFLLNWDQEVGIEIRNADMIELLKELFQLAKGYGKKIDFTRYVEKFTTF